MNFDRKSFSPSLLKVAALLARSVPMGRSRGESPPLRPWSELLDAAPPLPLSSRPCPAGTRSGGPGHREIGQGGPGYSTGRPPVIVSHFLRTSNPGRTVSASSFHRVPVSRGVVAVLVIACDRFPKLANISSWRNARRARSICDPMPLWLSFLTISEQIAATGESGLACRRRGQPRGGTPDCRDVSPDGNNRAAIREISVEVDEERPPEAEA